MSTDLHDYTTTPNPRNTKSKVEMSPQKYEQLSGASEHDDASSDATVHFADEEEARWKEGFERDAPQGRRGTAVASVLDRIKRFRWLVEAGLVALIVLLLVDRMGGEEYEGAGDVTGFAPECKSPVKNPPVWIPSLTVAVSQRITSFELNRDFVPEKLEDFFSDDVYQNWVDLVPRTSTLLSLLHVDSRLPRLLG